MRDNRDEDTTDNGRQETRRLVLNPVSGGGGHADRARRLAESYGFPVAETDYAGHGMKLAKQAAVDGIDLLAVYGDDGTVHGVIRGLVVAEALDSVTLCVVPAGTVNLLAESGDTGRLDLGIANDEPFMISAVLGTRQRRAPAYRPVSKASSERSDS